MSVVKDDGQVLGAPPRLVSNRVAECYSPGSAALLERARIRYVVVHHTSVQREAPYNPHPVPNEYLEAPALAGRFRDHGFGTGGATPYHGLTTWQGRNEQMLPLTRRGAHARAWNGESVAWAIVGEDRPADPAQLAALADVCAYLLMYAGAGTEIVGHTDLPGGSSDPGKRCPRPTVDLAQLRAMVRDRTPPGWQSWPVPQVEDAVRAAGFLV